MVAFLAALVFLAGDVVWAAVDVAKRMKDPVSGEADALVVEVQGSYVDGMMSMYDGGFGPRVVRFSRASGYAAYAGDFAGITEEEKVRVREFLKKHYDPKKPPLGYVGILEWTGRVYEARGGVDDWFRFRQQCMLACVSRADVEKSAVYRREAIRLGKGLLKRLPEGEHKARVRFNGDYRL